MPHPKFTLRAAAVWCLANSPVSSSPTKSVTSLPSYVSCLQPSISSPVHSLYWVAGGALECDVRSSLLSAALARCCAHAVAQRGRHVSCVGVLASYLDLECLKKGCVKQIAAASQLALQNVT